MTPGGRVAPPLDTMQTANQRPVGSGPERPPGPGTHRRMDGPRQEPPLDGVHCLYRTDSGRRLFRLPHVHVFGRRARPSFRRVF